MPIQAIHQMLAGCAPGDAISYHALQIQKRLQAWGYPSRLFAEHRDPAMVAVCEDYRTYAGDSRNLLIFHYSIGSAVTRYVQQLPDRLVLYYHNITPAHFLRGFNQRMAADLERGRAELATLNAVPHVLAVSAYNARELAQLGFAPAAVIPCFVQLDYLMQDVHSPAGRAILDHLGHGRGGQSDDWVNVLFVGRIVPNKRQDDLIRLFAYYQHWVRPHSRLLLVGSDANAGLYRVKLEMLIEDLDLHHVHVLGSVSNEELAAYYRVADVFVCLSEHEGFCVPLIEAMHMGVPVLAYSAAAVPDTVGDAGVLAHRKRFEVLAEMIELLASDADLRQSMIARQRQRVETFAPALTEARLHAFIERVSSSM